MKNRQQIIPLLGGLNELQPQGPDHLSELSNWRTDDLTGGWVRGQPDHRSPEGQRLLIDEAEGFVARWRDDQVGLPVGRIERRVVEPAVQHETGPGAIVERRQIFRADPDEIELEAR